MAHFDLISLWDAFSNTNDEPYLILDRFNDGIGCVGGWDIKNGCIRLCLLDSLEMKYGLRPLGSHKR